MTDEDFGWVLFVIGLIILVLWMSGQMTPMYLAIDRAYP